MKPYTTLPRRYRAKIKRAWRAIGEALIAESLGLNRATVARAAAGLPIRKATKYTIVETL